MTLDAEGDLLRPTHQKILEEEQARVNLVDMLLIYHCIMVIGREVISKGEFEEGTFHMATLHVILA